MSKKLLTVAAAMALAAPALQMGEVAIARQDPAPFPSFAGGFSGRPGKGKNRKPHHSSRRFVAMDKREARKARNRRG